MSKKTSAKNLVKPGLKRVAGNGRVAANGQGSPHKTIVKSKRKSTSLTAEELTLLAWQKTYKNRHPQQ